MPEEPNLRSLNVLIPRARRTIEGPTASAGGLVPGTLSDDQVISIVADAVAEAIFYTNGAFDVKLEVTARDPKYGAPVGWELDRELSEAEATVIMAQAALNYIFSTLSTTKTSETYKEADREWSYSVSANVLSERVKTLRDQRDKALELLVSEDAPESVWINSLAVRDTFIDAMIEPYSVTGGYLPSGQEFDPPYGWG